VSKKIRKVQRCGKTWFTSEGFKGALAGGLNYKNILMIVTDDRK
jgi:hypothetical protein